jgi:hypothetical protein
MPIQPRLTQAQQFILNELKGGAYILPFTGQYTQMSSGRTISKEAFGSLLREKVIKLGEVPPLQHGAKPLKAWIYAEPGDPAGGKTGEEDPVDPVADAAAHDKWVESWTTKFAALAAVPDINRRRMQIKGLVKQFADDARGSQRA